LLALIDVAAERTGPGGSAPETLSAKEVGRRVIELYWPQTIPYRATAQGELRVLSQAPQNDIPAKLAMWRPAHLLGPGASLEEARAADPTGWAALEAELVAIVIGMPLAKLQRFGDGRRVVGSDLVFLDPDNGLQVRSAPLTSPLASKYATVAEIAALLDDGIDVILYQHGNRAPWPEQRAHVCAQIASGTDRPLTIRSLRFGAFGVRAFFCITTSPLLADSVERGLDTLQSRVEGWERSGYLLVE